MKTQKGFYDPITVDLRTNNFDSAAVKLEIAKEKGKYGHKDRMVYFTDAGLAYHYAGEYDTSNARLHEADAAAEELFTKSISRAVTSVLLNDNVLEYAGEDYEILYGNLISALNYLMMREYEDAFVEIRRANLKLEQLEAKYSNAGLLLRQGLAKDTSIGGVDYEIKPVRMYNDAFARYLSMHMYAADGKWDDARIDLEYLQQAFRDQPYIYNFDVPDVRYVSDEGSILSVVALAGLAPVKEELSLRIRTDKQLNLVQIMYADKDEEVPGYTHIPMNVSEDYYFKFAIPELQDRVSMIDRVNVYVDGERLGQLQLLEDVGAVARETFRAKSSMIYIRTVLRAVAKGLIAHKQKQKADTGGLGGWLKKAAIDVVTDVSENPDLRCARLLPGRILVGDFVVEPGTYDLRVEFVGADGRRVASQSFPGYTVTQNGPNLIEAVSLQ
ncbi:MAG: hypothetical protein KKA42_12005 [candidate division Zixibacteria bacterium]|nr:hypothetical protein [candidate division Zixibacteria bacterium]